MKTPQIFTVGLAAFFIGAIFGFWFSQHRFDAKVSDLNASHELDRAGQAFLNLTHWQKGRTNSVHDDLVFTMEVEMVDLTPFVDGHPKSDVAARYYDLLDQIRQYQTRFRWSSGMTNWDSEFNKVLGKTAKQANH